MTEPGSSNQSGLLEEAAAWFARMRAPDAEASRADFEAWLARGALHRAAYNRASEIFAMGKFLADEKSASRSAAARTRQWGVAALAAGIAVLAILGTTWLALHIDSPGHNIGDEPSPVQTASLTAGAEAQSVRLSDGSQVRLGAGAILSLNFSASERRSRLERGLAVFDVTHEKRPFVVFAGGGSVTAHGTVFEVALSADRRVSVRLIQGAIDVKIPTANRAGTAVVRQIRGAGVLSFMARPSTGADPQGVAPPGSASAFRPPTPQEVLEFRNVRLADVLAIANRKLPRHIQVADPEIGNERISGRFALDDADQLAQRIAVVLNLVVDSSHAGVIVLNPK